MGVFRAKGWWPKTSCPPSKVCLPWVSKGGIWDVPGFLPGCPGPLAVFQKVCAKKLRAHFPFPNLGWFPGFRIDSVKRQHRPAQERRRREPWRGTALIFLSLFQQTAKKPAPLCAPSGTPYVSLCQTQKIFERKGRDSKNKLFNSFLSLVYFCPILLVGRFPIL